MSTAFPYFLKQFHGVAPLGLISWKKVPLWKRVFIFAFFTFRKINISKGKQVQNLALTPFSICRCYRIRYLTPRALKLFKTQFASFSWTFPLEYSDFGSWQEAMETHLTKIHTFDHKFLISHCFRTFISKTFWNLFLNFKKAQKLQLTFAVHVYTGSV